MSSYAALINIPRIIGREAASSWISRLALSQGSILREISKYLEIPESRDPDWNGLSLSQESVNKLKPMRTNDFTYINLVSTAFRRHTKMRGQILFEGAHGIARFRYCPVCLAQDTTPYFRVEWRIKDLRYCLSHCCLLEETCPHCEAPVELPVNMINGGLSKQGMGTLNECSQCSRNLSDVRPFVLFGESGDLLLDGLEAKYWLKSKDIILKSYLSRYWRADAKSPRGTEYYISQLIRLASKWHALYAPFLRSPHELRRLSFDPGSIHENLPLVPPERGKTFEHYQKQRDEISDFYSRLFWQYFDGRNYF
ncbi:MAG: TniQ family protein [Betaproteobacteria bacterium]|nr:TniQ family protein [Betaproteobacteria bacterium]